MSELKADPLQKVLELTQTAETKASQALTLAQSEWQKQQQQLEVLEGYRLEYMKKMEQKQGETLSASGYHQFHQFIKQIDDAIARQVQAVTDTHSLKQERQQAWLKCQQKQQAVMALLKSKAQKAHYSAMKQEQKLTDEFAMQQFYRQRQAEPHYEC